MKAISGKVASNKNPQTYVVEVTRWAAHPMYHKRVRRTKRYHAYYDKPLKIGDAVKLKQIAPMSKLKHWRIIETDKEDK